MLSKTLNDTINYTVAYILPSSERAKLLIFDINDLNSHNAIACVINAFIFIVLNLQP